jgi:glutamate formiminotransferase / 5-formyltetrahydrofolate cyclo-ligase
VADGTTWSLSPVVQPVVQDEPVLECVVNVSEGRRADALERLTDAAGVDLLDLHHDPHHHRAVLTLVGEAAPRAVATEAVALLDLRTHEGVHPRLGVVDVVPFVPLGHATIADAVAARDDFAVWAATALEVPCFLYGPGVGDPTLPELRRDAWTTRPPDHGPSEPHPTGGAICVGARAVLVAYNVWLAGGDVSQARRVATAVRRPAIRALGLAVGDRTQVSMNLIAPDELGPAAAYDIVRDESRAVGAEVEGAELVGLVPEAVLHAVPEARWPELDLGADRTIEARLAQRAARSGRP